MNQDYWVVGWAKWYQDSIVKIPQQYKIHPDFTLFGDESDVRTAFAQINELFSRIFGDIAKSPDEFAMPLYKKKEHRYFSQQSRNAEQAPLRLFILLHQLLTSGYIQEQSIIVPIESFKSVQSRPGSQPGWIDAYNRKVANAPVYFAKMIEYGFVFEGLKKNKLVDNDITITYPDNTHMLFLLKMLADKSYALRLFDDFVKCSFRLLKDNMHSADFGYLENTVDALHEDAEKEFVIKFDEALLSSGFIRKRGGNDEGPGLKYFYGNNAVSSFEVAADGMGIIESDATRKNLMVGLRIRNVNNCLEYLKSCPDSVLEIFTHRNDTGCKKRFDNKCKHGVSYEYSGTNYWRCACCGTAFSTDKPNVNDINHYIKLLELGEKK